MRPYLFGQKWLLGFALALIYIPLRTYMNVPPEGRNTIPGNLPQYAVEIVISTIFYTTWIYFADFLLKKIAVLTGTDGASEFKIVNQLITLVPAILFAVLFNIILSTTWGMMDQMWSKVPRQFLNSRDWLLIRPTKIRANEALTILALIAAYYLCVNNQVQERLQKLLVDSEKLEKENINARFLALKNQISPHFLFNNLSVLSSLVESQPEKSSEFIQQLSQAYRYILEQAEFRQISLKQEIKFLETYTYLLRTRFKEKVLIDVKLTTQELEKYEIIPLTLQLLIENAVKHNTMSMSNPLQISIYIEDNTLIVSNPLQLRKPAEATTKLGLKNIIARYKLLQNKQVAVDQTDSHFIVKIPLI